MDVVLLATSACLTACLCHYVNLQSASNGNRIKTPVAVALGLGFSLVTLTIVENLPSSLFTAMLLFTRNDVSEGHSWLNLTAAYRIVLWAICLWVVVVVPTQVGCIMWERIFRQRDKKTKQALSLGPWWVRYGFILIAAALYRVLVSPVMKISRRQYRKMVSTGGESANLISYTPTSTSTEQPKKNEQISTGATTKHSYWQRNLLLGCATGITPTFVILRAIGSVVIQSSSEEFLPTIVSWLCAVGMLLSSVLNGFGSVSMPHSCLVGIYLEAIDPEDIKKAEDNIMQMRKSLDVKRCEAYNVPSPDLLDSTMSSAYKRRSTKSFFSAVSNRESQRKKALLKEVQFLETLCGELSDEVVEMYHSQQTAAMARTPVGRIRGWLGIAFSVVLLVRLASSVLSIWQTNSNNADDYKYHDAPQRRRDPITSALLWSLGHNLVEQKDYNTLSQCISLALTACLSFSQFRFLLRTIVALNRRFNHTYQRCYCSNSYNDRTPSFSIETQSSLVYYHILGSFMSCYFISCVVLIKRSVPPQYRSAFSAALGGMDYSIHSAVTNTVFCVSAVVSASVLVLLFGIQRQNSKRYGITSSVWARDNNAMGNLDMC